MSSQFYVTDFFLHFDLCQSSSLSTLDFSLNMTDTSRSFYRSIRKNNISRCRSSTGSCRSSTRIELLRDWFVEICFVVLGICILIIEFWIDVLILYSLYSSIEFWYQIWFWQHMERDYKTLWKWANRKVRQVLSLERSLLDHPWSNFCRWHFFTIK